MNAKVLGFRLNNILPRWLQLLLTEATSSPHSSKHRKETARVELVAAQPGETFVAVGVIAIFFGYKNISVEIRTPHNDGNTAA